VLGSMRAARWAPNEHNYGIMIQGLLAGGLTEEAGALLKEARGRASKLMPLWLSLQSMRPCKLTRLESL